LIWLNWPGRAPLTPLAAAQGRDRRGARTCRNRRRGGLRNVSRAGIADATRVVRAALENVMSASSVFLLTEVVTTALPEPRPENRGVVIEP
jgi:hypothetical protein